MAKQCRITHNCLRFASPVNAPPAIDVIRLFCRNLHEHHVSIISMAEQGRITHKKVRLPSPVNAPLAIDVIRLNCISLHDKFVNITP